MRQLGQKVTVPVDAPEGRYAVTLRWDSAPLGWWLEGIDPPVSDQILSDHLHEAAAETADRDVRW